jgi:hypothetical protein
MRMSREAEAKADEETEGGYLGVPSMPSALVKPFSRSASTHMNESCSEADGGVEGSVRLLVRRVRVNASNSARLRGTRQATWSR